MMVRNVRCTLTTLSQQPRLSALLLGEWRFFPEGQSEHQTSKAATEAAQKGIAYVYLESQRMGRRMEAEATLKRHGPRIFQNG